MEVAGWLVLSVVAYRIGFKNGHRRALDAWERSIEKREADLAGQERDFEVRAKAPEFETIRKGVSGGWLVH